MGSSRCASETARSLKVIGPRATLTLHVADPRGHSRPPRRCRQWPDHCPIAPPGAHVAWRAATSSGAAASHVVHGARLDPAPVHAPGQHLADILADLLVDE